jgi:ribonuclease BN (tRNA processing enzyme)
MRRIARGTGAPYAAAMVVTLLGSGGFAPSAVRETACVLVRDGARALLLDAGSGVRRLLTDPQHRDGLAHLDVVLTHFHLDHVCGLPYLSGLPLTVTVWAPGAWLYGQRSAEILAPLRRPPLAPTDVTAEHEVRELGPGEQCIGGFAIRAGEQPRHWSPTAGLRIDDELALVTDTPYEPSSARLAERVRFLLHEAWSASSAPSYPDRDATAADAARVACEAGVGSLTLVHVDPALPDPTILVADAAATFERVELGEDERVLR